jgi:hypothetical protein
MDIRQELDIRIHYDSEVERWIEELMQTLRAVESDVDLFSSSNLFLIQL